MLESVLVAVSVMGGLGVVVGIGLAVASKVFYVYVDPAILAVDDALPGANCGGCGYPGCTSNAEAIVAGKSSPNSCVAAGAEVAEAIAAILGVTVEAKEPDIALPGCTYGVQDADLKYIYDGLGDCRAAALLSGGMKVCSIGCMGLGSCVKACQFGALSMGPDNLPVVDPQRCTGCGACERVCPKHIINLSSVTRRIIREYTTDDCTTPCQRACPAGIDICEYIRQISLGDYHRAVQVIKERNPFPTVIGRICPRPCENDCRRQLVDEPVAINFLKRFAADYERQQSERILPYKAPESGRRVAVVGGGIQGLSAAFFLARLGHGATVYEASERLGGLLRSAIAAYRLPAEILDWDIEGVLEMGVAAETGKLLGRDYTVAGLLEEGVEAVFLAAGGWDSRLSRGSQAAAENPVPGTRLLIDFLKALPVDDGKDAPACAREVVIAGGGEPALEAGVACRRLGAETVTVAVRETLAEAGLTEESLSAADAAGVTLTFETAVIGIGGQGDQLGEVELVDVASGDRRTVTAQSLLIAGGRYPELIFAPAALPEETEEGPGPQEQDAAADPRPLVWVGRMPYKPPTFVHESGWLSPGDALTDFSAAIKAIAAGRRAAASTHLLMYGLDPTLAENTVGCRTVVQDVDRVQDVASTRRQIMPLAATGELETCELEKGFSEKAARSEAQRCLQCGLICYQHTAAPEPAESLPVQASA